jgi:hypothetical protein
MGSIHTIARSSPYRRASSANGATLTAQSPPSVTILAGSCSRMTVKA